MKLITPVFVAAVVACAGGCASTSRPSEAETRQCVQATEPRIALNLGSYSAGNWGTNYPLDSINSVEFGKAITSQGGIYEMSVGAPNGAKIFPVNIQFASFIDIRTNQKTLTPLEPQVVRTFWLFKDSFGKLQCVEDPTSN